MVDWNVFRIIIPLTYQHEERILSDLSRPMFNVEKPILTSDSTVITRDTLIRGNRYSIFEGTDQLSEDKSWRIQQIFRDSSGYLVDQNGWQHFSNVNFTDYLNQSVESTIIDGNFSYDIFYLMENCSDPLTVEAGIFQDIIDCKGTIAIYSENEDGYSDQVDQKINHMYYSKGNGMIKKTYVWIFSDQVFEKRLSRYQLHQ